ncbi:hypothetical protein MLD38_023920 [Melastoma candidum]|uniref:Uncharacterized protein n=1 Tax=Melastoma candidum TaxID=119954 RepID=A0ACB9NRZ5_9MYRT|nr:hypothetical protein MLD38_023920 [Melastoma candidum]
MDAANHRSNNLFTHILSPRDSGNSGTSTKSPPGSRCSSNRCGADDKSNEGQHRELVHRITSNSICMAFFAFVTSALSARISGYKLTTESYI